MSGDSSDTGPAARLDQAVAAFVRQELGSPVAAIIGYLDILLEDVRRERLEDFVSDLGRMRSAATNLLTLIGHIVDGADSPGGPDPARLRHELRTPLNAIKGYGELILEEVRDGGAAALVNDLAAVLDLAERLLTDIDRIAAFRDGVAEPAAAPPIDIVREVLRSVEPLAAEEQTQRAGFAGRILIVDDDAANRVCCHAGSNAKVIGLPPRRMAPPRSKWPRAKPSTWFFST